MWLNDIYHAMSPIAFSLGPLTVRWYGLGYLFGFLIAGVVIWRTQIRWKLDLTIDDIVGIISGIALGVIIGARLGYVIFYGAGSYFSNPLRIFALNEGGMSFHGGLVGAIIGGTIVCKKSHISIPTICDLCVIGATWGVFFVRCANFVNGELWGKECNLPWGVMFSDTGGGEVYRHPTQLYEALLEGLVMFFVLYALSRKVPPRPQGTFFGCFLMLYGLFRILIEFVRLPDAQLGYLFGTNWLTMGQILSIPLLLAGIAILIRAYRFPSAQQGHLYDFPFHEKPAHS